MADGQTVSDWRCLGRVSEDRLSGLQKNSRQVIKIDGRQIAVFRTEDGLRACANRCPHEGFPLVEGTFAGPCTLVCNWHGWAFDLNEGKTLTGGDRLRIYPIEEREGEIWIDLADPPQAELVATAHAEIAGAVARYEYDRIARGLARLKKASDDPVGDLNTALAAAIHWGHDRLEYGAGHAWAASADWLTFAETESLDGAARLIPWLEALAHIAFDNRMGQRFPFSESPGAWDEQAFLDGIERQDENAALSFLGGALNSGMTFQELLPTLRRAALSHYAGFGHAIIYTNKSAELVTRLGEDVAKPLALSLVRYYVNASRDDLIPEFCAYSDILLRAETDGAGSVVPKPEEFVGLGPTKAMQLALQGMSAPEPLYDSLLGAAALMMLRFDEPLTNRIDQPISQNVGWLDFTHAITFAGAVREAATADGGDPSLWHAGLLQMACFVGRNAGFIDRDMDIGPALAVDSDELFGRWRDRLVDHGEVDPIYSCHILKLGVAIRGELTNGTSTGTSALLLAALNRFMSGHLKRRHVLRTVSQAEALVAREDG